MAKITTTVCNKCGKVFEDNFYKGIQSFCTSFGYESRFDGQRWGFDLCDDCLEELVNSFIHKPNGYMVDPYEDYANAMNEFK